MNQTLYTIILLNIWKVLYYETSFDLMNDQQLIHLSFMKFLSIICIKNYHLKESFILVFIC